MAAEAMDEFDVVDLLRPAAATSEAVEAALGKLPTVREGLQQRIAAATSDLRLMLVAGSRDAIEHAERTLDAAQRNLRRLQVLEEHLAAELVRLRQEEARAAIEEEAANLEAEAERLGEWFRTAYHKFANQIAAKLSEEKAWLLRRAAWQNRVKEFEGSVVVSKTITAPASRAGLPGEMFRYVVLPKAVDGFAVTNYEY